MDTDPDPDPSLQTQQLLLAASNHDHCALRTLLRSGASANVQDPETGFTPLHAAIAACEAGGQNQSAEGDGGDADGGVEGGGCDIYGNGEVGVRNGDAGQLGKGQEKSNEEVEGAKKTLKLLFQHGAIWNDLDNNGETPGCLAWRLGLRELYDMMVDAGVRAELLLNRLDGYEPLADDDGLDEEDREEEMGEELNGADIEGPTTESHGALPVTGDDAASHGETESGIPDVNNAGYLASELTFQRDRLLDADANGVMMAWETEIMRRSADILLPKDGLRVLNVGHGMGIIDNFFQSKAPAEHHIIEAHPGVLAQMRRDGWYDKPNVTVHEGKWQDVVPKLIEQNATFDAIYFDTFAEEYKALREFFSEHVVGLLDTAGKFGFFNGLGADRQVCYDVYAKVVEMDLFEAGFDTEWETLNVPDLQGSGEWEGVRRRYWTLQTYKLPTCTFIG